MMEAGDIVEWRGLNRWYRGTVMEDGHVMMPDGHTFALEDISQSKSIRIVEQAKS